MGKMKHIKIKTGPTGEYITSNILKLPNTVVFSVKESDSYGRIYEIDFEVPYENIEYIRDCRPESVEGKHTHE